MRNIIIFSIVMLLSGALFLLPNYSWDLSQNKLNSLSPATLKMLETINKELSITVYSVNIEIINSCADLLNKYKDKSKFITLDIEQKIADARTLDHLIIKYDNRQKIIELDPTKITEENISNLLQQVIHNSNRWIVFITGHQEADITDSSELGLSKFSELFNNKGFNFARLNLAQEQSIPNNTSILVIANPQFDFMPLEKVLLHNYIAKGGKLLWFTEPDSKLGAFLQQELGVKLNKELVLDHNSLKLGSPHPAIKILNQYPKHTVTAELNSASILPWSGSLEVTKHAQNWISETFLAIDNKTIGMTLTKNIDEQTQRIAVVADSSFILNKYLPLYANAHLVTSLIAWFQNDAHNYVFSSPPAKDVSYQPGKIDRFLYKYGFTLFLPLLLIGIGLLVEPRFRFKGESHEL